MQHKFGTKSGAETRILRTSTSYYTPRVKGLEKMSDGEENTDTRGTVLRTSTTRKRNRQGNTNSSNYWTKWTS